MVRDAFQPVGLEKLKVAVRVAPLKFGATVWLKSAAVEVVSQGASDCAVQGQKESPDTAM
jgi:hypothetical protein